MLRAVGIPNRIHGFTIDKALQKGAITGFWYNLSPKNILHSWVEVWVNDQWYFLEGVIIDKPYLTKLQKQNQDCRTKIAEPLFAVLEFTPIVLKILLLNGTTTIRLFRTRASIRILVYLTHLTIFIQNISRSSTFLNGLFFGTSSGI